MNNPIVFVELHLLVHFILKLTPLQPYSQQQKETLFFKFVFRNPLMALLPELIIIDLTDDELPPSNIGLTM